MGFRNGAYATVWAVESISPTNTKIRISINAKDKQTGDYKQDFGGFCNCYGTVAANKALQLKERDRIKLGDVDISSFYSKEKNQTYYTFKIWSFELLPPNPPSDESLSVDEGEIEPVDEDDEGLPF